MHDAAGDLQTAYDKQRQLSIDLQNMYQTMLHVPDLCASHPALGGFDPQEMAAARRHAQRQKLPALRRPARRHRAQRRKATDIAYTAATTCCTIRIPSSPHLLGHLTLSQASRPCRRSCALRAALIRRLHASQRGSVQMARGPSGSACIAAHARLCRRWRSERRADSCRRKRRSGLASSRR